MADIKKPPVNSSSRMIEVLVLIALLMFIWIVIARVQQLLSYYGFQSFSYYYELFKNYFINHIWPALKLLSFIVGGLSIVGIFYNNSKLKALKLEEKAVYGFSPDVEYDEPEVLKNSRWTKILELINSMNESDWRQAIIEADIMLDELLTASGYHGDSIGEKLQTVEPSDFLTLDDAWTAHKVRNRIAHDGASFQLNEREAKQTISDFEKVFTEFKVI